MSRFGTGAMGRVVRSGVGRRRVQTVVMALAVLMAVTSAIVAGSLMLASSGPFERAFAQQHGAHLAVQLDPQRASTAQIAATAGLPGVVASAGPYQEALIVPPGPGGAPIGQTVVIVGRAGPGGAVDDVGLVSGRWAQKPGEVVLSADSLGAPYPVGSTLKASAAAGSPVLHVVGTARSVSRTADGWVLPSQIAALRAVTDAQAPAGTGAAATQMLYRFASAGTAAEVRADRAELAAALPSGAIVGAQSYLDTELASDQNTRLIVPIMTAFGVLGLLMSLIIVASVVSGAVGAGVRRIGILKSVGFTPGQVVRAYVAQALVPAAVGTAAGVLLGNLFAAPLLGDAQQAYGTGTLSVTWWLDLAVPAAALGTVALAALVPALRAGRLRTVEAIAVGRAPRTGRGQWAQRAAGRLPLPRPVTLGLASPFAHPVRTAGMLAAVIFGTAAVTFAVGLTASATAITTADDPDSATAVVVFTTSFEGPDDGPAPGTGGAPPVVRTADSGTVRTVIAAEPGTAAFYGRASVTINVAGVTEGTPLDLYQGDSRAGAYPMISGHWFTGPGQVVVPTHFLTASGHRVGDTVTLVDRGVRVPVRIVGEDFDPGDGGLTLRADLGTLAGVEPGLRPDSYNISLDPGVSADAYTRALGAKLDPLGAEVDVNPGSGEHTTALMVEAMAGLLTLMLVGSAGLGVLNSVVLDTRERVHDLGVCKAVGMTPGQTVVQVLTSVLMIGAVGGLLGVPAGIALHNTVIPQAMHDAGTGVPAVVEDVYHTVEAVLLGLGGAGIAVLGALLPAGWAARARTATALRTE